MNNVSSTFGVVVAFAIVTACAIPPPVGRSHERGVVTSNILRADYAGTEACQPCHPAIHESFLASPMHRMTRHADGSAVQAPFDGASFHFKNDSVVMELHEGRRYMRVEARGATPRLFRITKVIGGHYREDYVGQEVKSTAADSDVIPDPEGERVMPVSWLLFAPAWRYKGYSVMVHEREHLRDGMPWRQTCIFCHNTAPRLDSLYDDLLPTAEKYQGSVSERFLPPSRLWHYEPIDAKGLSRAISEEVALLGRKRSEETLEAALESAVRETRRHFDEPNLLELGIGCEACHNGSKQHVADPTLHPSFEIQSDLVRVRTPRDPGGGATRAAWINRTCARCHTVLFSEYPYTWEGGQRAASPGGTSINSGEARDFILGSHADRMPCTSCHDPHAGSRRERLEQLGTVAGNPVCTSCHAGLAARDALAQHTHHEPAGEGSACLSCHMAKKNMGLAYRLTRYHRIGSPTDRERVEGDRPLECALCHVGKSVQSLLSSMEQWWGRRYDRNKLLKLYGRLDANALAATIAYGKPHEEATAAAVLGERGGPDALALIIPTLANPYPLVRYFARHALEQASGGPVPIDVEQDPASINRAAALWLSSVKR